MRVLLVDDEPGILEQMGAFLRDCGYEVETAASADAAMARLAEIPCRIALVDLRMPGVDGMTLAHSIRREHPQMVVLIMTAFGSVDTAVAAIKGGVHDFLLKPVRVEQLEPKLRFIADKLRAEDDLSSIRRFVDAAYRFDKLIGGSPGMRRVFEALASAAENDLPVLLVGETGTGKELAAHAVHTASRRRDGPFVAVNCGAIPEHLVEAELFGHVRGAFTGAEHDRAGKLVSAQGGTLFFDELASAADSLQVKLLRALEEKRFSPLGSERDRQVDVRIIAATNQDPEALLASGRLRADLFYRLNVLRVDLPPLRERTEDIPLLVHHLIARSTLVNGRRPPKVRPGLLDELMTWTWPGNVRQLQNVLDAALSSGADEIGVEEIPEALRPRSAPRVASVRGGPELAEPAPVGASLDDILARTERLAIEEALATTAGHMQKAAARLGVTERGLRRKLARLGIDRARFTRRSGTPGPAER